ncbi:heme exporter protein CcmD [Noviherbaspirillum sp. UKPF54]|uniref:heme exporter protein CcmD n=1 Tax=Noviherbaspirillum sp. UKPF54 TaxID=2601898 RepID=UPI0011B13EB2|nr:heme exporter protein CcmD [Noviherbaspirillum sp. UKPF54]QDZ27692.1 heme exporter protein CcmD [Noviherbaspirillum sp. UKPF54]
MIWNSWSDFFAMGGYALYVWGSFLVMFGMLGAEVLMLQMRRKSTLQQLRRWVRNNARHGRKDGEGLK